METTKEFDVDGIRGQSHPRVMPTGGAAFEAHPDVFVDEEGLVFSTRQNATGKKSAVPVDVQTIGAQESRSFVVEDETVEAAVDWIGVLCGDPHAEWRIEQRPSCRWHLPPGSASLLPESDYVSRLRETRTFEFQVRSSHRFVGGSGLACEIYPHVFVGQRGVVASRYAGMAMQQPGEFVSALPAGTQEWFSVQGLQRATSWVSTVAKIRDRMWLEQHGGETSFGWILPIGPVGPAVPARRRLPR